MEGVVNTHDDQSLIALKQEHGDPFMTNSIVDLDLYSYLSGESQAQALDETVDLDVIPQPRSQHGYPSPSYESEGVPSPSGMDGGMSPVSTEGDSEGLMSELKDVDFSDLMLVQNDDTGNFTFNNLLKDAFKADQEPESGADTFNVLEIRESSSNDDVASVSVEPVRRSARRNLTKPETISLVKAGEMPKRSSMKGPKVVRVANRSTKEAPQVEYDDEGVIMDKNNKNAIQARINRQKKKAYVQGLEDQVEGLQRENRGLRITSTKLLKEKDSLAEEVAYLKSVLANDSALAGLLNNIGNTAGVSLSTSFTSRKRAASTEHDHDYGRSQKKVKSSAESVTGGVCLHVDQENVSLEFCSACARKAKESS